MAGVCLSVPLLAPLSVGAGAAAADLRLGPSPGGLWLLVGVLEAEALPAPGGSGGLLVGDEGVAGTEAVLRLLLFVLTGDPVGSL